MDLFHFGNRNTLVQLENDEFNLFIIGENPREKTRILKNNLNQPATIKIFEGHNKTTLKTITDYGDLALNLGNTMMPCFFEDGQYQLVLEKRKIKIVIMTFFIVELE